MQDVSTPTNMPDFSGLDMDFDIIDSHHHLFDLSKVYYPWLSDTPNTNFMLGNYDAIMKDYSNADFKQDIGDLRVVKSVHVEAEADHENSIAETRFLAKVMETEAFPNAIAAHSWVHLPESEAVLAAHAEYDAVRSIRSKPVTSTSIETRAEVRGKPCSMQDENWRKGLGLLRKYNLNWELRMPYWHLMEAVEICGLYPDMPIVVEHTGLSWDRSEEGLAIWRAAMKALAAHEHVCLRISELGIAGYPWDYIDNRRVVREAIEIFGFERCMFASNFPVAKLRIGYVDLVKAIAHMVQDCSKSERAALFHDTAKRFYRL